MEKNGIMIAAGCAFIAVGFWMFFYPVVVGFGAIVMIIGLAGVYFGLGRTRKMFAIKWKKRSPPKKK